MPQYRKKVAFSGKKKKEQLKGRRAKKHGSTGGQVGYGDSVYGLSHDMAATYGEDVLAVNQQPGVNGRVNRYNLKFRRENPAEKEKRQKNHSKPVETLAEEKLEASSDFFYPPGLSYPTRPPWKKGMSKCNLDMSENRHFRLYCEQIDKEFHGRDLSMYELNLETWRQLWRVTEMADILLVIVDARFPVAQFPPYLYKHLVEKENKGVVLILNKCDLLPPSVIVAWQQYFSREYPKLMVVSFSSLEGCKSKRSLLKMAAESALCLVDACQRLVEDAVNLQSWRSKIEEERHLVDSIVDQGCQVGETSVPAENTLPESYQRFKDGILTVGTIGHPNVGKSSLINALMGKKVVSVSKTPGHTKHFQTIFLTKDIKLCDCPGLVFPSTAEMPLQVMLGSFPIAQVRDPISVVQYIAARLNIPDTLKLHFSVEDSDSSEWTSYLICEAWAEKRGYRTKSRGSGAPDVHRAANELLRFCLNGQKDLILFLRPPGYTNVKEKFELDPGIEKIKLIQGFHAVREEGHSQDEEMEEESDEYIDEEIVEGETKTEGEDDEDDDTYQGATTQNKFALLLDD